MSNETHDKGLLFNPYYQKDWEAIADEIEAGLAQVPDDKLRRGWAWQTTQKKRLLERLGWWRHLIGRAAGLPPEVCPTMAQAEAMLQGWAMEGSLRRTAGEGR